MGTALARPRAVDIARSEGWRYGFDLSDEEAGFILWNHTGFPGFWPSRFVHPIDAMRYQLDIYFEFRRDGFVPCARCGGRAKDWLCPPCTEAI